MVHRTLAAIETKPLNSTVSSASLTGERAEWIKVRFTYNEMELLILYGISPSALNQQTLLI